jgi:hypothetical protein
MQEVLSRGYISPILSFWLFDLWSGYDHWSFGVWYVSVWGRLKYNYRCRHIQQYNISPLELIYFSNSFVSFHDCV